jgi:hypothetical protein
MAESALLQLIWHKIIWDLTAAAAVPVMEEYLIAEITAIMYVSMAQLARLADANKII